MARRVIKTDAVPSVANPDAVAIAQKAADAAGLDLQGLADLLIDNGLVSMPPPNGIQKSYTLQDLGDRLWGAMQCERPSNRHTWFDHLSDPQKVALIVTLRTRGFTPLAIANDFNITERKVRDTFGAYANDLGAQVVGIRLETMVGNLQLTFERAMQMASEAGDFSAMWKFQKELVSTLQSIGIVERATQNVHHTHDLSEESLHELDELAALQNKKRVRLENIAEHEASVEAGDNLPANLDQEDRG
tara:strand:- start:9289 stop:10026 length:738 start_codon:yes stop_codon:yes gene_type:complete